jgi:hypothetical protein
MENFNLTINICRLNDDDSTYSFVEKFGNGENEVFILSNGHHFELITQINDYYVFELTDEGLRQERIYNRDSRQARSEELSRRLSGLLPKPPQDSEARRKALEAANTRALIGKTKTERRSLLQQKNIGDERERERLRLATYGSEQGRASSSTRGASSLSLAVAKSSMEQSKSSSKPTNRYSIDSTVVLRKGSLKTSKFPKYELVEDIIVKVTDQYTINGISYYNVINPKSGIFAYDVPEDRLYGNYKIGERVFLKAGKVKSLNVGETFLDKEVPVFIRDIVFENQILHYIVTGVDNGFIYIDIPEDRLIRKAEL